MFCAGLLVSIADLLWFLTCGHQNTICSASSPFGVRNAGGQPASSPPRFMGLRRLTGSCEYHTASSRAFQPGTCRNRLIPIMREDALYFPRRSLCTIPRVGICLRTLPLFLSVARRALKFQEASCRSPLLHCFSDHKSTCRRTSIRIF